MSAALGEVCSPEEWCSSFVLLVYNTQRARCSSFHSMASGRLNVLVMLLLLMCASSYTFDPSTHSYRIVLTFQEYRACQAWEDYNAIHQCTLLMVKCYGRRLVLNAKGCPMEELDALMRQEFFLVGVEEDVQVVAGDLMNEETAYASLLTETVLGTIANRTAWDQMNQVYAVMNDTNMSISNPDGMQQWNLPLLGVPGLWQSGQDGSGRVVAVLDSGIAASAMLMLEDNKLGYDFISDPDVSNDGDGRDNNPLDPGDADAEICPGTSSWHGTYVSSVLAARRLDVFSGIAYNSTLLSMRVLGRCRMGYALDVADAIVWAVGGHINGLLDNPAPARVVSMSFAGLGRCPSFMQSAVDLAINVHNATLFAAAGNNPSLLASDSFPANCKGVISVGASDETMTSYTEYTSRGAENYYPGGTYQMPIPCVGPYLQVQGCIGTSMSVPHTAGLRVLDAMWRDPFVGNVSENETTQENGGVVYATADVSGSYSWPALTLAGTKAAVYYINIAGMYSTYISTSAIWGTCEWQAAICFIGASNCQIQTKNEGTDAATVLKQYGTPVVEIKNLATSSCSRTAGFITITWGSTKCGAGYYLSGTSCAACPLDTFSTATGATSVTTCTACASGKYSSTGKTVCTTCTTSDCKQLL
jgi:hypothetical protein